MRASLPQGRGKPASAVCVAGLPRASRHARTPADLARHNCISIHHGEEAYGLWKLSSAPHGSGEGDRLHEYERRRYRRGLGTGRTRILMRAEWILPSTCEAAGCLTFWRTTPPRRPTSTRLPQRHQKARRVTPSSTSLDVARIERSANDRSELTHAIAGLKLVSLVPNLRCWGSFAIAARPELVDPEVRTRFEAGPPRLPSLRRSAHREQFLVKALAGRPWRARSSRSAAPKPAGPQNQTLASRQSGTAPRSGRRSADRRGHRAGRAGARRRLGVRLQPDDASSL